MSKLTSIILFVFVLFQTIDLSAQKYNRSAHKDRKKTSSESHQKQAYNRPSKPLYLKGMKTISVYGNHYGNTSLFGVGSEYYLNKGAFVSVYGESLRQRHFDSKRITNTLGIDGNYNIFSVNNVLFLNGFCGFNVSTHKVDGIRTTEEVQAFLTHVNMGGEMMLNVLRTFAVYTDIRHYYCLNDKNGNKIIWSIGAKFTFY